jgi:hypothetical protein
MDAKNSDALFQEEVIAEKISTQLSVGIGVRIEI